MSGNAARKRDSASAIADVIEALMVERDHYREALERIASNDWHDAGKYPLIAREALGGES